MAITITQLTAFLAVVRSGSVTAAAEELVVTQPSVSAALSALAREVGVDLTERSGRNLRLSAAGEAFAPFAAEVLGLLEQGRAAAQEAGLHATRRLRIAAVTTAGEYVVPPLLRAFAERHPEITVSLDVGNRHRVFEHVREHRVDLGIGGRPPADGGLSGTPFLRNEIVLITAPDDRLAALRSVPLDELGRRTWLLREEGSGTRALVEDFLAHHDLEPSTPDAGLERGDQERGAVRPRHLAAVAARRRARATVGPSSRRSPCAASRRGSGRPHRAAARYARRCRTSSPSWPRRPPTPRWRRPARWLMP